MISICRITELFIKVSLKKKSDESHENEEFMKKILTTEGMPKYQKFEIAKNLDNKSIPELCSLFDIIMFQNYLFMSKVKIPKNSKSKKMIVLFENRLIYLDVPIQMRRFLLTTKEKRKDDLMNSIFKYIQRKLLENFQTRFAKKPNSKELKRLFKAHFFDDDEESRKFYYSNLFNRTQLMHLQKNQKLAIAFKEFFETDILDELLHTRLLKGFDKNILNTESKYLFSKDFLHAISKKQMLLVGAINAAFSLEEFIIG